MIAQLSNSLIPQCVLGSIAIQLATSIFAKPDYLWADNAMNQKNHIEYLAETLFLPGIAWAGIIICIAITVLIYGLVMFVKKV